MRPGRPRGVLTRCSSANIQDQLSMSTIRLLRLAVLGMPATLVPLPAAAGAGDYELRPVAADVRKGPGAELAVRIVHKPTGQAVPGAVIFRTRLDMSPDGMETMTAEAAAVSQSDASVYRFRADLTMAGRWALKLMAKVQGESETVVATVVFQAR
jgi:hypothetical protein